MQPSPAITATAAPATEYQARSCSAAAMLARSAYSPQPHKPSVMARSPSLTHRLAARWRITPVSLMAVGQRGAGWHATGRAAGGPACCCVLARTPGSQPARPASQPASRARTTSPGPVCGKARCTSRNGAVPHSMAAPRTRPDGWEDPAGPGGALGRGPVRRRGEPAPPDDVAGGLLEQVGQREAVLADRTPAEAAASQQRSHRLAVIAAEVPHQLIERPGPAPGAPGFTDSEPRARSRAAHCFTAAASSSKCSSTSRRRPGQIVRRRGRRRLCCGPRRGRPRGAAAGPAPRTPGPAPGPGSGSAAPGVRPRSRPHPISSTSVTPAWSTGRPRHSAAARSARQRGHRVDARPPVASLPGNRTACRTPYREGRA